MKPIRFHPKISLPPTSAFILSAVVVGMGAGLGAVFFRRLIHTFKQIFFVHLPSIFSILGHSVFILIPAIGALFFSPLIYFLAREARGHGVPEVMEAMELKGGRIRPIVGLVKALASSLCIGSGGSVGREGPIVQIGSAIGSTIGQAFHLPDERTKILVACGAAGGIAATFNAPIGGMFFALEVIMRDFSSRQIGGVVIASVIASIIGRIFLGSQPMIAVPQYTFSNPIELIYYILFGLVLVPLCILFIESVYKIEDVFRHLRMNELLKPVLGGLLLGSIGFFYPHVFGVGYENIVKVLNNQMALDLMLILLPLKILAVSITLGSGGSGGIFAPSLVVGSLAGGSFGFLIAGLFPHLNLQPGGYALVGMGAFFAGAAQAPITAILILFELTGDYLIILPLMFTVILTTVITDRLHPESIYTMKLIRRGIDLKRAMSRNILENIRVDDISIKKVVSVSPYAKINEIVSVFENETHGTIPVVSQDGTLKGIIGVDEILTLMRNREILENIVVAEDISIESPYLLPSDNLYHALKKFIETNRDILPVVRMENGQKKMIGLITKHDLLIAYHRELSLKRK